MSSDPSEPAAVSAPENGGIASAPPTVAGDGSDAGATADVDDPADGDPGDSLSLGTTPADRYIGAVVIDVLEEQQRREDPFSTKARPPSPISRATTHVRVFPLGDDEQGWEQFHNRFTDYRTGNVRPWYRCLGVLRGLGAATAIVETHYVCLDWRSEVATFYGSLDAPRKNYTIRVHYFGKAVREADVTNLTDSQKNSYLGYMVLREGELPLVGRTVLKLPKFMDTSAATTTAVVERVHFYGQNLQVRGVPFMQQDNRFAVCAHLVAWMAHYTAYRRGVLGRRFIADFVSSSADVVPMRPTIRQGLQVNQVIKLFRDMGLRCIEYTSPMAAVPAGLPAMRPAAYPELTEQLAALFGWNADEVNTVADLGKTVTKRFREYAVAGAPDGQLTVRLDPHVVEVEAVDAVLAALVAPYLKSRLPAYLGTPGHALLLCGTGEHAERTVHYVHDDMNGPYLVADSLIAMSRQSLAWQSGYPQQMGASRRHSNVPPIDRVLANPLEPLPRGSDTERAVETIVIPTPPRSMLASAAALDRAGRIILDNLAPPSLPAENTDAENGAPSGSNAADVDMDYQPMTMAGASTDIMMGIDYKANRCDEARRAGDEEAVVAFASVHLAEWVVVVQGREQSGRVPWEVVFDGPSSAGERAPRIQCIRARKVFLAVNPRNDVYDYAALASETWDVVTGPEHVGKSLNG